ncbi:class III lanthionine synthetase LanKC [Microbacterium sp. P07]|uniref:class III lanthionine synthetase LanKC n=1 Tax=Microbacterium sp. P07 TaxID=3366952 RepID=UPI00374746A2
MDPIYPRFAVADAAFYDHPMRATRAPSLRYALDETVDWSGWDNHDDGNWSFWHPRSATLPDQGWKIHVSAVASGANDVLRLVSTYCHRAELAFKHLPHRDALTAANSKDAERSSAGKFLTIYPRSEAELHDALVALDELIGGRPGPYVLTDLRWNAGPLSVRYGAFVSQTLVRDGAEVLALRDPATGELVEDVRTTAFVPPAWVTLPPFLQAQLDALGDGRPPEGFPDITGALHHSNSGGVYTADDDGAPVVVKEARPATGFTPDDRDAVARLRHEEEVLRRIRLSQAPAVHRSLEVHGHRYLVMERIDGHALNKEVVRRNPRIQAGSTAADRRAYRDWALGVLAQVRTAVDELHAAGYSHGDLHPANVIVRPDGRIALLDFEMAQPLADDTPPFVGAPGFSPPDRRGGARHDLYGLACIELFVFIPLLPLLELDPLKAGDLARAAAYEFELPAEWAPRVLAEFDTDSPPQPGPGHGRADRALRRFELDAVSAVGPAIEATATQLVADADFARDDRAWPGDPRQFAERPYGLAHGAAGVLVALHDAGEPVDARATAWFGTALAADTETALGLYDGLAGAVWTLRRLHRHTEADRALVRLRAADPSRLGDDLYSGLPGVGLTLLAESDADATLTPLVMDIAARVQAGFDARARPITSQVATGSGGLLRGRTGTALFALRLYERTGDARHLRLAERAIDDDLATLTRSEDGSLQVDEGWRAAPYLASGSTGIGAVITLLLAHSPDNGRYLEALDGITRAAITRFCIQSGVFAGRAGLIHFLLILARRGLSTPESDAALSRHVRELRLNAIRRPDGLGFTGDGLLRLSCDLATGSAGVLSALTAYRSFVAGEEPADSGLPFLTPPAVIDRVRTPVTPSIERG